ncbi:hypothetical protein MYP_851 [Sporocytophaga myxococcoides]|uniref:Uncharacterized protein n=1 Tax=Sporocytophaga myxococcoides TaxID=153721 RepID=A0A098LB03_9BACT|nr:hypothetical protein [Sporocytophaga myxococcoides]GAL83624.1 hypothetical protein MYP_851 [Sporocytophaga myxococcoides]
MRVSFYFEVCIAVKEKNNYIFYKIDPDKKRGYFCFCIEGDKIEFSECFPQVKNLLTFVGRSQRLQPERIYSMKKNRAERIKNVEKYVLKAWFTAAIMGIILIIFALDFPNVSDNLFTNLLVVSGVAALVSLPLVALFWLLINYMISVGLKTIYIKLVLILIGLIWNYIITVLGSSRSYTFLLNYNFVSVSFYCYSLAMCITILLYKLKVSEANRSI